MNEWELLKSLIIYACMHQCIHPDTFEHIDSSVESTAQHRASHIHKYNIKQAKNTRLKAKHGWMHGRYETNRYTLERTHSLLLLLLSLFSLFLFLECLMCSWVWMYQADGWQWWNKEMKWKCHICHIFY